MILIGASGSTKCDWQLVKDGVSHLDFSGKGINPLFHDEATIVAYLKELTSLNPYTEDIREVYVYSAGCHSKSMKVMMKRALAQVFPKSYFYVNHDIVAAAFATYEGVPCITGFLGTGSNACYFDGDIVRQEVAALDYILGDEGSGSYFGKELLRLYFYKSLPDTIKVKFEAAYSPYLTDILDKIYMQPYANIYLASYMKFIQENQEDPFIKEMIRTGFGTYLKNYILCYSKHSVLKTHFVGAVAYHFQDSLREVCEGMGINMGKVIEKPIDGLVTYHISKLVRS